MVTGWHQQGCLWIDDSPVRSQLQYDSISFRVRDKETDAPIQQGSKIPLTAKVVIYDQVPRTDAVNSLSQQQERFVQE